MTSSTVDQRYGRRRSAPRLGRGVRTGLIVLVLLLCVGGLAWYVLGRSSAPSSRDLGYDLKDSQHASLDFEVTKKTGETAVCAVKAQATDHSIVGWKEITVGPGGTEDGGRTSRAHADLRITRPATTVTVDSCWAR